MSLRIRIISPDKEYINKIVGKLASRIKSEIQLEYITDEKYFVESRNNPKRVNVEFIDEAFLTKFPTKAVADNTFVISENANLGPELGESLQGLTLNDIFLIQNDALNVVMQESNSGIQLNQQEFNTLLGEQFFGQLNEQLTGLLNEQSFGQLNERHTGLLNEQTFGQLNEQLTGLLNEQAGFVLGMINFGEMMAAYGDFTVLQNGEFGTQLNENVIDLDALGEGIKGISLGEVPQLNFY